MKPLDISREEKLANYIVRVLVNDTNPINILLQEKLLNPPSSQEEEENQPKININTRFMQQLSFINRSAEVIEAYEVSTKYLYKEFPPVIPPWRVQNIQQCDDLIKNSKKMIPENSLKMIFQHHLESHKSREECILYTDGSKTSSGTAYAVTRLRPPYAKAQKLQDSASVYTAELTAILSAVHHLSDVPEDTIAIVSDSRSSIQALSSLKSKCPLVNEIRSLCHRKEKNYFLCWAPSHVGIVGNEQADRLANKATKKLIRIGSNVTRSDSKSRIKFKMKERWRHR